MLIKIVSFLLGLAATSLALQCYTCVYSQNDPTCLDDPAAVQPGPPTVDCNQGNDCCTIVRGDYLEDKGTPWTFQRGCQPNCTKEGVEVVQNSYSIFYNTYCKTPLCNFGDGLDPLGPCPTGYSLVEGYCFKVPTDYLDTFHAVTYDEARALCQADGGSGWKTDLVTLKKSEKLEALETHIIYGITHHTLTFEFWVGAEQIQNTWKWIDGTKVNLQSHIWYPDSPPAQGTDLRMRLRPTKFAFSRVYAAAHRKGAGAPSYVCEATKDYTT